MKKWIAGLLSLVLTCTTAVPALASTSIVGKIVDSDGDIAGDNYDSIRPGDDYYYIIGKSGSEYDAYMDDDLIRFSLDVEEGKKYIDDEELVEKKFDSTRYICIAFSVEDTYDDEEYKAVLEANFRARKDLVITNPSDYKSGDAFPTFRRATSSDGSYSDADIAKAKNEYDTASNNLETLKDDIAQLEQEIADLEKQINDQKAQESQKQSDISDAQQKLDKATAELTRLQGEQAAAQTEYDDAEQKLQEEIAKDEQAYQSNKASYDAAKQPLENALTNAENDKVAAETALAEANVQLANAEALLKQHQVGPTHGTPETLRDYMDSYKTSNLDPDKANLFNTALTNYKTAAGDLVKPIPSIAIDTDTNTDNCPSIESVLSEELARVNQLILDTTATVTAEKTKNDNAQIIIDTQTQAITNLGDEPTLTKSQAQLDAEAILQTKQSSLTDANKAVTAQQDVVDDADQALKALQTKAPASTPLEDQLKVKQNELNTKKSLVSTKEAAVTNAKNHWEDMKSGSSKNVFESGDTFKYTFKVYIQNENIIDDDATFRAGEKGIVVKPVKNEWNTVTWEDENRNLASLEFRADSDVSFYCPRLSTHWNYYDYADYFDDTDAYLFNFVDSPTIPAATRPTLTLYNPFVDDDDDLTVRTSRTYIYEVDDGELIDVTDEFDFERNDDDDYVMTTKTRTLGTYIVSNGRANLVERPVIEVDYDDNDNDNDSNNSASTSGSTGGHAVNNNQKPVPWTGR